MATGVTVTTSRLTLRPVTERDAAFLHALWSLPDVRRYLWDDAAPPLEAVRGIVAESAKAWRSGCGLWVLDRAMPAAGPIGFCGFRAAAWETATEVVYGLAPEAWGHGFATEAARAALAVVFGEGILARVVAAVDGPNEASIRVLHRLGMKRERRGLLDGRDTLFYAQDTREFMPPEDVRWDRPARRRGGDSDRR